MDELKCPLLFCPVMIPLLENLCILFGDAITPTKLMKADLACIDPNVNRLSICVKEFGNFAHSKIFFI